MSQSPPDAASERAPIYAITTADAGRSLPSFGPEWGAAIEFGVDVTLILRNLELTPRERIEQALAHQRFIDDVHGRTLSPKLREELEQQRLWEKIDALGGPDPGWPEALRQPRTWRQPPRAGDFARSTDRSEGAPAATERQDRRG